jgi:hypothetical protein
MILLIISIALFAIAYAWQRRSTDALFEMKPYLYKDVNAAAAASYFAAVLAAMLWIVLTVYEHAMAVAL